MAVDPHEIARKFEAQGYAGPVDACSSGDIEAFRREFDALEARVGREHCQHGLFDRHREFEFIWRMATAPAVVDCIEAIVGPDVLLLSTNFFCKYPAETPTLKERLKALTGHAKASPEVFVDWHQDLAYWGLDPAYAVTAWIAVDDSDIGNGCMRVIPESHAAGVAAHTKSSRPGNVLLSRNQALAPGLVDESRAVDLVLRAGQMSLHHGMMYHGSNPNRSRRRRCGVAVRFSHPGVRAMPGVEAVARRPLLLRGVDRYGHWPDTLDYPFPLSPLASRPLRAAATA